MLLDALTAATVCGGVLCSPSAGRSVVPYIPFSIGLLG